jgi:hypothetical protein
VEEDTHWPEISCEEYKKIVSNVATAIEDAEDKALAARGLSISLRIFDYISVVIELLMMGTARDDYERLLKQSTRLYSKYPCVLKFLPL